MGEIIGIVLGSFIFIGWIWLAMTNARRALMVGKDPTSWGLLSLLLFPLGAILIRLYLLKKWEDWRKE